MSSPGPARSRDAKQPAKKKLKTHHRTPSSQLDSNHVNGDLRIGEPDFDIYEDFDVLGEDEEDAAIAMGANLPPKRSSKGKLARAAWSFQALHFPLLQNVLT